MAAGDYVKTVWLTGDIITATKLNNNENKTDDLDKNAVWKDGSVVMTGNLTAPRFISNIVTGTAPFSVASTTLVTNLNADRVDGLHFRLTGEVLERSTDGITWKAVGNVPSTKNKGSFSTSSDTFVTALSVSGTGKLKYCSATSDSGSTSGEVRITVDGTVITTFSGTSGGRNYVDPSINLAFGVAGNLSTIDLAFISTLLIELRETGATAFNGIVDFLYELI